MNRLTWYQPSENMEDIIIQSGHVGIYDGDLKHSIFEQGTVSLTLYRIIWADSNDPECRLILHHSLVEKVEKHQKSMFRRGGKIYVHVAPSQSNDSNGPVMHSSSNFFRLFFRSGGEDEFYVRYREALSRKTWQRSGSASTSIGSRSSGTPLMRTAGIGAIEKKMTENHHKTHEHISQAFEDMSRLMEYARDMVNLSKCITEKLRSKRGEIADDETIRFKSYLLSLGVSDPVTKSSYGSSSKYYEKLAEELVSILEKPLQECGGMMTLPDVYCRVNRARGMELISPEDLFNACQSLQRLKLPISLRCFQSGVMVVQLNKMSIETTVEKTASDVIASGCCTAGHIAQAIGVTVALAKERLLAAEEKLLLCRDDSVEGLIFYPNRFLNQP